MDFTVLGYEVRLAQDADVALAMIRDKRPDLVVLDINMPGKDGLDLLREIMDIDNKLRSSSTRPTPPISRTS